MAAAASAWPSTALVSAILLFCLMKGRGLCAFVADFLVYLLSVKPFLKRHFVQDGTYQKEIQVIICGFPRTGTMTMMFAMQILGFSCFHGFHFANPSKNTLFKKAMEYGMAKDWKALLDGFGAIADWPAAVAYKELMEVYPNAKLILTLRDPVEWYKSFSQTILKIKDGHSYLIHSIISPIWTENFERYFTNIVLRGKPTDRESCIECYHQHIESVKACVDPSRLLIYEVKKKDGWNSLCEFLNVPHPNVPFPSSNNRTSFLSLIKRNAMIRTVVAISYLILFGGLLTIGFLWT